MSQSISTLLTHNLLIARDGRIAALYLFFDASRCLS